MRIARRTLLIAAVATPGAVIGERLARSAIVVMAGATSAARPAAFGTTASRCAQCGAVDHSMLDPQCPLAPKVLG